MTRYEMITNMSLEEMALFFKDFDIEDISCKIGYCNNYCPLKDKCDIDLVSPDECYDVDFKDAMKIWLSQEEVEVEK